MIAGPASSETASAVSVDMIVRNVRYWNRWNPLTYPFNRSASSSSMTLASVAVVEQRADDAIHRRRARALDQHRDTVVQIAAQRRDQRGLIGVMRRARAE